MSLSHLEHLSEHDRFERMRRVAARACDYYPFPASSAEVNDRVAELDHCSTEAAKFYVSAALADGTLIRDFGAWTLTVSESGRRYLTDGHGPKETLVAAARQHLSDTSWTDLDGLTRVAKLILAGSDPATAANVLTASWAAEYRGNHRVRTALATIAGAAAATADA